MLAPTIAALLVLVYLLPWVLAAVPAHLWPVWAFPCLVILRASPTLRLLTAGVLTMAPLVAVEALFHHDAPVEEVGIVLPPTNNYSFLNYSFLGLLYSTGE